VELRPERIVRSPDGREWRVRVRLHRLPPPGDPDELVEQFARRLPLVGPLIRLVQLAVAPVVGATVGHRPWLEASAGNPPVTMVWRATGRESAKAAVDEIADALERGEERPVPLSARWVGYDRGWIKLRRKL
jgi:hypothetical protein